MLCVLVLLLPFCRILQAGVLSLLTAVLLNASPTCTPAEASSRALPPNFVEAAHLVMAVLNNVCRLDLVAGQYMLSCAHHRMEFYHLISFLLSYCLSRWPAPMSPAAQGAAACGQQWKAASQPQQQEQPACLCAGTAPAAAGSCGKGSGSCSSPPKAAAGRTQGPAAVLHHPIAQLLNQVLLLIGYFCVQHPSNQAMLSWGRSPSILQRLCSLPAEYLQVPELRSVLLPTLLCVCHGAERTCEIVAQHFDLEVLLQYVQQQLPQQGQPLQQQLPAPEQSAQQTRHERRRQRRAHQRQQQLQQDTTPDPGRQQQPLSPVQLQHSQEELGQQLPAHAHQILQQVRNCCSSTSSSDGSGNGGASSVQTCTNHGTNSNGQNTVPGRSRAMAFALCRRFPVLLLPLLSQQLQAQLSLHRGSSSSDKIALPQHHATAAALTTGCPLAPRSSTGNSCHRQGGEQSSLLPPLPPQQQQDEVTAAEHMPARPPSPEAVALALQLPQASAAKLVCCEVVACS